MKITVRAFSLGLLTASLILFIIYLVTDESTQAVEELSVEELTEALEEKGYRTITEDEFISYSVYLDEKQQEDKEADGKKDQKSTKEEKSKEKDQEDAVEEEEEQEEENEEPKTISFKVEPGFVSQDIGEILKDEDIIDDASEFVRYMEDNGYSSYIQIGTFKVNSDMTLKEIAETLTTFPGN